MYSSHRQKNKNNSILNSIFFLNSYYKLKEIKRSGWIEKVGIADPETVTDHTLLMVVLVLLFTNSNDFSQKKKVKLIEMALLHDLGESIIGDLTPDSKNRDKKTFLEDNAMKLILDKLHTKELKKHYKKIWEEYKLNESFESKLIRLFDKLEMALQAHYYIENKKGQDESQYQLFFNSAFNYALNQTNLVVARSSKKKSKDEKYLEEIKQILTYLCN